MRGNPLREVMMLRPPNDGAARRKERMNLLLQLIEKHGDAQSWSRIKGFFMLQTGLSLSRIESYGQELDTCGFIEINSEQDRVKYLI